MALVGAGGATGEEGREHEGLDRHQLDEDVEGRPGGVLERVPDRVAGDGGLEDLWKNTLGVTFVFLS